MNYTENLALSHRSIVNWKSWKERQTEYWKPNRSTSDWNFFCDALCFPFSVLTSTKRILLNATTMRSEKPANTPSPFIIFASTAFLRPPLGMAAIMYDGYCKRNQFTICICIWDSSCRGVALGFRANSFFKNSSYFIIKIVLVQYLIILFLSPLYRNYVTTQHPYFPL